MISKTYWLMTGSAVVIALGAGFGAAQILDRPPAKAEHAEAGHAEDENGEAAFVALTPQEAAQAGVSVVAVQHGGGAELKLPGRVAFAPGAEAAVDAPLGGAVVRVHVGLGDRVAAGSPLITVRSPDGAASRADADAAGATVQAARAAERRDRALFEQGWVSQARLDVTAAETRRAEAQHRAARARVGAFGAPGADGLAVVRSPIAGVVTRLSASPGQVLHEEALQVAAVADPGRVELVFEAPPAAAAILKVGDRLESTVARSRVMSGVVVAIAPANPNGVVVVRARPVGETPPAGSVVSARVSAGVGTGTPVVPLDAVQTIDGAASVFVQEDGGFRARPVVTGRTSDGRIEIVSGLTGTERIAGVGAFLLKAELAKGEAEHGH
ncbi:efflux RND transporter periplasmic adaptor subunit [uncultured Brevundimonas sp.]|uniref:efflux RND transporter periplasmic adaptor subunit n=1 Tax=uncultured Brevundimonas sp. TaxID=213418 RepID=UPI0025D999F8|nr:efflux RND transporter periplasmic adaptor subunit [uncultured Brevundimonas sp.]